MLHRLEKVHIRQFHCKSNAPIFLEFLSLRPLSIEKSYKPWLKGLLYGNQDVSNDLNSSILELTLRFIHETGHF